MKDDMYCIYYRCPDCGAEWEEWYSCPCDSECSCGCGDISPYEYEKV